MKQTHNERNIDRILHDMLDGDAPNEVQTKAQAHFEAAKERLMNEPNRKAHGWFRLSWAGAGMAGTLLVVMLFSVVINQSNITWADVKERFKSVNFFSATVYITENPLEKPEKIEIWMGKHGKCRMHKEGCVYFGENGELTKAIHARSGQAFEPERGDKALGMFRMLGRMETFSLEELLKTFCGKQTLSEPLANEELGISEDMKVFDISNDRTPEWVRIWVLKASGLPVRFRLWDPRYAESVEVLFDYVKEQPAEAFDPDLYQKTLNISSLGRGNQVYALLKDPGGQAMTPRDVFERTGYHMPEVKEIGMTKEGVVWVVSTNSRNRTPDGRTIEGFGQLTDNWGQRYLFHPLGHRVKNDLAVEYYIPYTFRLDYKTPDTLILTATTQPDHSKHVDTIIGRLEIEEWVEDKPIPDFFGNAKQINFLKHVISEAKRYHDWDRFDRLLGLIEGEPEESEMAFYRDYQLLEKRMAMGKTDEAYPLARRLIGIVEDKIKAVENFQTRLGFQYIDLVENYILLLCKHEEEKEAKRWVRFMKQQLDAKPSQGGYDVKASFIATLANALHDRYRWNVDRIIQLLEIDIREERYTSYLSSFINHKPLGEREEFQPWVKYANKVFDLYKERELPARMELVRMQERFDTDNPTYSIAFPDRPAYVFSLFKGTWDRIARSYAIASKHDPRLVRVSEGLQGKEVYYPLVVHEDVSHKERYDWILQKNGVEVVEKKEIHKVWVAKYDGRPLPHWREVRPADGSHLGRRPDARGGGTHTTITSLLDIFEMMANDNEWDRTLGEGAVIILDETGLPTKPGENQTFGSICLTYTYAFWDGEEGIQLAKSWFEDTFGITFHEEERELAVLEFRKK
ncbi:hypothetical protein GF373_09405 [bacterium]|nr:hypothetical protein [bacterium]